MTSPSSRRVDDFRKRWEAALSTPAEAVAVFNDLLAYAQEMETAIEGHEAYQRDLNEAFNRGDGSYHP